MGSRTPGGLASYASRGGILALAVCLWQGPAAHADDGFPTAPEVSAPDLYVERDTLATRIRVVADDLDAILAEVTAPGGGHWAAWRMGPIFGYGDESTFLWATVNYNQYAETLDPADTPGLEDGVLYGPGAIFQLGTYVQYHDRTGDPIWPPAWVPLLRLSATQEDAERFTRLYRRSAGQILEYVGDFGAQVTVANGIVSASLHVAEPCSGLAVSVEASAPQDAAPLTYFVRDPYSLGEGFTVEVVALDTKARWARGFWWADRFHERVWNHLTPDLSFSREMPEVLYLVGGSPVQTLPDTPYLQFRQGLEGYLQFIDPPGDVDPPVLTDDACAGNARAESSIRR